MKRIKKLGIILLFLMFSQSIFARNFFIIDDTQVSANYGIILCLNGYGPLTCQNYTVTHEVLNISTVIPGHTYPAAGIKVITPGFTIDDSDSNCSLISNGYCIFSVSDSSPATIIVNPNSQSDPGTVTITVSNSLLGLNVNGPSGSLTITNTSTNTTAFNIISNFTNTALQGNVQETGNTCQTLAPGASCTLTYTPGPTPVAETIFLIQGNNTTPVSAAISIDSPTIAEIRVLNSSLSLQTSSSGSMTIKNASSSITATNIASNFTSTALNGKVTETGNTCASILPNQTCTLTFTAGATSVAETTFPIQGSNTNSVNASISISTPATAELQVSNSPLLLNTNGVPGTLTIKNISNAITATNITSDFTSTALNGNVTETGNTCSSVAPGNSCVLTYTPGATSVSQTSFTIAGTNTNTVSAAIQIATLSIGSSFGGGKVGCLTSNGGFANLIAAISDTLPQVIWQPNPLFSTGATSSSNGATNTSTIVAMIGSSPDFAASRCVDFQIDSAGNSPCQTGNTCYKDWYLPALNELNCLFQNKNAIGGFTSNEYWTSTEKNKNSALSISFSNGKSMNRNKSSYILNVRCVRAFTP